MRQKLKHIFFISSFYAVVIFSIIRSINDSLMKKSYWASNEIKFIISDLVTLFIISFIIFLLVFWMLNHFQEKKISIIKEYGILAVISTVAALSDMQIARWISDMPMEWDDIPVAVISSILVSSLFYGYFRNQIIKKKVEEQDLLLEKFRNDQLQTELKLLKAQYNPHFLFNVLNTVYFQIEEENETPRHTIELLSDLLRYQLYNDGEKVLVSNEIEYLDRYIGLCKMRAKECLRLKIDFDEKLNEKKVYPLMFTPLVENAFKYVGGDYEIDITMRLLTDNNLLFEIINTIPEKEMPKKKKTSGIGIENLKRRLELLYPNSYNFDIKKGNSNFTARLTIKV